MLKNATKMLQAEKNNDYDYYLYQNSLLSQHSSHIHKSGRKQTQYIENI